MLKKFIKKVLCVSLTTVMLMSMVTPTSAATFTPKKSHTDAEVQERALYLIDKADDIAFSPYSGFAGDANGSSSTVYADRKKNHSYMAYAMCEMLLATPNLTSACSPETVAELKKARNTWKSAYISDSMYAFYRQVWYDTYNIVDDKYAPCVDYKNPRLWDRNFKGNIIMHNKPDKIAKQATVAYNRVKKYIAKYQKYNPTLATKLNKWNKTQYKGYKKLATKLKGFTENDYIKATRGAGSVFEVATEYYNIDDIGYLGELTEDSNLQIKIGTWYTKTKGMHWNSIYPDAPFYIFARNVKYGAW